VTSRRVRFECLLILAVATAGSVACAPGPPGAPVGVAAADALRAGGAEGADGRTPAPVLVLVNWRFLDPGPGEPVPVFDAEKSLNLTAGVENPQAAVPPDARFELVVDGVAVPLSVRIRGPHVTLTPEPGAPVGLGTLSARGAAAAPVQQWTIRLRPAQDPRPEVAAALEACRAGRTAAGLESLARMVAGEPPTGVHWLLVEQARCFQGASKLDEALTAWTRAAEGAAQAGLPTEQARRLRAAAFVAIQTRRFGEARGLLDRTDALDALPGPAPWRNRAGAARTLYYRGLLEGESGNLRGAVEATRAAVSGFEALGLSSDAAMAREWLVYQHQRAGSDREALALLGTIERQDLPEMRPADRARFLHNRAWFHAAAMDRGALPRDDAAVRRAFEDARTLFSSLGQTAAVAEADVNLAWMELRAGEPLAAARRLAALDGLPGGAAAYSADFRRLLRGEIALAFGRADEARSIFDASARRALEEAPGQEPEERWRALHGLGRAYERLGRPERADVAYRAALTALEGVGRRTLLRSVRAGFFDARHALVEDALRLALSRRDGSRVFEVVLRSQARLLGDLEASVRPARLSPEMRKVWDARVEAWARARQAFEDGRAEGELLPARALAAWRAERARAGLALTAAYDAAWSVLDQAAPPAPETSLTPADVSARLGPEAALLDFFRLDGAIHALQIDAQGLRIHRPGPDDLLAGVTLAPTVQRLYIVPGEVAAARALPVLGRLGGRPLADVAAVSLLPHAGLAGRGGPSAVGGPVLLVADPSGNLPIARREALRLQTRYPAARLLLGDAARRTDVLDALRGVSLFHFAGHGVTHPDDPWAAHLALADEQTLTLEDVLVAGVPADLVVLSGCETGASVPVGDRNGVGLAEAFLAAGARTVLATERVVGDIEAGAFVARFHEALATTEPGGAWQAATRADPAGSEAFRLFGALEGSRRPR
jgi:tetratricopeptide (TPR) repeat protein